MEILYFRDDIYLCTFSLYKHLTKQPLLLMKVEILRPRQLIVVDYCLYHSLYGIMVPRLVLFLAQLNDLSLCTLQRIKMQVQRKTRGNALDIGTRRKTQLPVSISFISRTPSKQRGTLLQCKMQASSFTICSLKCFSVSCFFRVTIVSFPLVGMCKQLMSLRMTVSHNYSNASLKFVQL